MYTFVHYFFFSIAKKNEPKVVPALATIEAQLRNEEHTNILSNDEEDQMETIHNGDRLDTTNALKETTSSDLSNRHSQPSIHHDRPLSSFHKTNKQSSGFVITNGVNVMSASDRPFNFSFDDDDSELL